LSVADTNLLGASSLWVTVQDLEGSGHGLTEVLSQHLPGWTEEKRENLSQDILAAIQTEDLPNTSLKHEEYNTM
jgi:hypothetical protein